MDISAVEAAKQEQTKVGSAGETKEGEGGVVKYHPNNYQKFLQRALKMISDCIYNRDDLPPRRNRRDLNWKNSLVLCLEKQSKPFAQESASSSATSSSSKESELLEALKDKGITIAYSSDLQDIASNIEAATKMGKGSLERVFKFDQVEISSVDSPPPPRFITGLSISSFECRVGNSNSRPAVEPGKGKTVSFDTLFGLLSTEHEPSSSSVNKVAVTQETFTFNDYMIPDNYSHRPLTKNKIVKFVLVPPPRVIRFFYCYFDHVNSIPITTTEGTKQTALCLELPLDSDSNLCLRIIMPTKIGFFDVLPKEVANTFAEWNRIFCDDVMNTETMDGSKFAILVPEFAIPFSDVKLDKILESMGIKSCFDRKNSDNFGPLMNKDDKRGFYMNNLAQLIKFEWKPIGSFPNAENDPRSFIQQIKRTNRIILSRAFYFNVVFRLPNEKEVNVVKPPSPIQFPSSRSNGSFGSTNTMSPNGSFRESDADESKRLQSAFPRGNYIPVYTGYLTDPAVGAN
jgi:hypothetical protein